MYRWINEIGTSSRKTKQRPDTEKQLKAKIRTRQQILDRLLDQKKPADPKSRKLLEMRIQTARQRLKNLERQYRDGNYGKRNSLRTKPKKQDLTQLEKSVQEIIANLQETTDRTYITKEDAAIALNARISQVEQVFQILNRKRILSQPVHHALHDTNREPNGCSDQSAWVSDRYYFTNRKPA